MIHCEGDVKLVASGDPEMFTVNDNISKTFFTHSSTIQEMFIEYPLSTGIGEMEG